MEYSEQAYNFFAIRFSLEDAKAILNKDEDKLNELAMMIDKYVTWIEDKKMIYTKGLFDLK